MSKSKSTTGLNVGGSSILVIFVLLCLTTFATLSMVSANADYKLSQRTAVATQEYYAADALAQDVRAEIEGLLFALQESAPTVQEYIKQAAEKLPASSLEVPLQAAQLPNGQQVVRYSIPVNNAQELLVELEILESAYRTQGAHCRPTQWQVQNLPEAEEQASTMGGLWGGGGLPSVLGE